MKLPSADLRIYPDERSNEDLLRIGKKNGLGLMAITPLHHISDDFSRMASQGGIMSIAALDSKVLFQGEEIHVIGYMKSVNKKILRMLSIQMEGKEQWLLDQLAILDNLGFQNLEKDLFDYLWARGISREEITHEYITDCIFEHPSHFSLVNELSEGISRELFIQEFLQERRKKSRVSISPSGEKTILPLRDFSEALLSEDGQYNLVSLVDADAIFHNTHDFHMGMDAYIENGINAIDIHPHMSLVWVHAIQKLISEKGLMLTYGSGSSVGGEISPGIPGETSPYLDDVACHRAVQAIIKRFGLVCPH